jgi:chromosome segregation ATPase
MQAARIARQLGDVGEDTRATVAELQATDDNFRGPMGRGSEANKKKHHSRGQWIRQNQARDEVFKLIEVEKARLQEEQEMHAAALRAKEAALRKIVRVAKSFAEDLENEIETERMQQAAIQNSLAMHEQKMAETKEVVAVHQAEADKAQAAAGKVHQEIKEIREQVRAETEKRRGVAQKIAQVKAKTAEQKQLQELYLNGEVAAMLELLRQKD